jgi:predicted O-methyltransferase YrrM
MNLKLFQDTFLRYFPPAEQGRPTTMLETAFTRSYFDPCFHVQGMTSVKKQKLLNIAFGLLPEDECYVEIGTYQGKSLISAMKNNPPRPVYACDNFSEFAVSRPKQVLMANLARHGLAKNVVFYQGNFNQFLASNTIKQRIGVYFYDGAHDLKSQYDAIANAEHRLADEALVIVDDWRFGRDSDSYAEAGTRKAIAQSKNQWRILYALPARYNGDHALWWNGVAILAFHRKVRTNLFVWKACGQVMKQPVLIGN